MASLGRVWVPAVAVLLCGAVVRGDTVAPDLTRRAVELLQQGKPRKAIAELQRILREHPAYFPAYSLLGVSYSQLGRPEQAQPYLKRAVELAPNSLEARINLGSNYLALRQPAKAAAEFERVLAANPGHVNAWVNLANSRLRMGKPQDALAALERAQALAPGDLEVQLVLADVKFHIGRTGEALEQLARIGSESPDPSVQLALGLLLERNGHSREAAVHLSRCGQADSGGLMALAEKSINEGEPRVALALLNAVVRPVRGSAAWHALIGYAQFKLGNAQPALEHLQQAVRLDPENEDYYLELAEYLGSNNAVSTVVTVLETAAKRLPESVKIRTALGVAYLMQSDFEKAEATLTSVIRRSPGSEIAHQLLADCYNRMQNWPALKEAAANLRRLDPKNALGWYYGAIAEHQMFEKSAANASTERIRTYTEKAVHLDPGHWRSQVLRGKLLARDGLQREAIAAFRKAVAANPEEPTPHYLLATTLRQAGQTDESKLEFEAFRKAQEKDKARRFRTLVVEIQRRELVTP